VLRRFVPRDRGAAVAVALVLLAGCSRGSDEAAVPTGGGAGARLEQAAIATGVIADPDSGDLTGVYARDLQRICVVPAATDFRIGVMLDYGQGQRCSGAGTVARDGARLHIDLGKGCRFDAGYDGERIAFPGALPDGCSALCSGRASLAGMAVDALSNSLSEALTVRDRRGRALCGDTG
jgi:hypothetical protein